MKRSKFWCSSFLKFAYRSDGVEFLFLPCTLASLFKKQSLVSQRSRTNCRDMPMLASFVGIEMVPTLSHVFVQLALCACGRVWWKNGSTSHHTTSPTTLHNILLRDPQRAVRKGMSNDRDQAVILTDQRSGTPSFTYILERIHFGQYSHQPSKIGQFDLCHYHYHILFVKKSLISTTNT
jgi:hypothetical protein